MSNRVGAVGKCMGVCVCVCASYSPIFAPGRSTSNPAPTAAFASFESAFFCSSACTCAREARRAGVNSSRLNQRKRWGNLEAPPAFLKEDQRGLPGEQTNKKTNKRKTYPVSRKNQQIEGGGEGKRGKEKGYLASNENRHHYCKHDTSRWAVLKNAEREARRDVRSVRVRVCAD
jgi:hypothetical protein